jgi:hypothetical protein
MGMGISDDLHDHDPKKSKDGPVSTLRNHDERDELAAELTVASSSTVHRQSTHHAHP